MIVLALFDENPWWQQEQLRRYQGRKGQESEDNAFWNETTMQPISFIVLKVINLVTVILNFSSANSLRICALFSLPSGLALFREEMLAKWTAERFLDLRQAKEYITWAYIGLEQINMRCLLAVLFCLIAVTALPLSSEQKSSEVDKAKDDSVQQPEHIEGDERYNIIFN